MRDLEWSGVQRRFEAETRDHTMTVLHRDGVSRHLRFARPGMRRWSWDILTWPGHLAVSGEVGHGWQFAHGDRDVLPLFVPFALRGRINPYYWSERVPPHRRPHARRFSPAKFQRSVREQIAAHALTPDQRDELLRSLDAAGVFDIRDRRAAGSALAGRWAAGERAVEFADVDEMDVEEWDGQFLLSQFAILFATTAYAEYERATGPRVRC